MARQSYDVVVCFLLCWLSFLSTCEAAVPYNGASSKMPSVRREQATRHNHVGPHSVAPRSAESLLFHRGSEKSLEQNAEDVGIGAWSLLIINSMIIGAIALYLSSIFTVSFQTAGDKGSKWYPILLLVLYMGLSTSHTFAAFAVSRTALHPIVPTICVYVFKLAIAIGMNMQSSRDNFAESMNTIWHHRDVVVSYVFPAACMCFADLISFFALTTLSAAEYQLLLHCRLILVAPVWQCVLKRKLVYVQWILIGVCFWAMLVKERSTLMNMSLSHGMFAHSRLGCIFVQLVLGTVGNVFSEKLLTSSPLSVSEQNVILYSQSLLMLGASLVGIHFAQGLDLNAQSLHHLFDFPVAYCIFSLSTLGIVVSFLLKSVGNITKELAGIAVTLITVAIEALYLHKGEWHTLDGQAVLLITLSVFTFSQVHLQATQSGK
eukprot:TRINITY_DN12662_c0_g2_i1.p1 TRINITY_DN12662_c0_g2~~TRINITY_DN12662_c0_g2_i1.p1  ORF type:complete len:433 (+),score=34.25 TRINITY_DN12662_c0_g2_i1:53-1351(+)